jgi:uracil-DNA glycosylase
MNFTREDVLRELELLPVWKLRQPLAQKVVEAALKPIEVAPVETLEIELTATKELNLEVIASADKNWVFVLPEALTGQAETLFNNILLALQLSQTHTNPSKIQIKQVQFASIEAKVIVAMGEKTAQQLLNSAESIESLRGKAHQLEAKTMIVTYHPNDMLQHLPNKAKTWEDLCLAKRIVGT